MSKRLKRSDRASISKTEREWKIIDRRIRELGSNSYNSYLNKRISSLCNDFIESPQSVCDALKSETSIRQKRIPEMYHDALYNISVMSGVPISTIIDRIIVQPLLIEK
jgi:hypothetical protein